MLSSVQFKTLHIGYFEEFAYPIKGAIWIRLKRSTMNKAQPPFLRLSIQTKTTMVCTSRTASSWHTKVPPFQTSASAVMRLLKADWSRQSSGTHQYFCRSCSLAFRSTCCWHFHSAIHTFRIPLCRTHYFQRLARPPSG